MLSPASQDAPQRLLMLRFIYLTDLRQEGKECGSSCRGTEGTFEEVPQCSVPHYCFLMRKREGLQRVSHLAAHNTAVAVFPIFKALGLTGEPVL